MNIERSKHFENDVKYYTKKKKLKKLLEDLRPVLIELEQGNLVGDRLSGFNLPEGAAFYKVRIANTSANYSKKDDERVPNDAQILMLVKNIICQ